MLLLDQCESSSPRSAPRSGAENEAPWLIDPLIGDLLAISRHPEAFNDAMAQLGPQCESCVDDLGSLLAREEFDAASLALRTAAERYAAELRDWRCLLDWPLESAIDTPLIRRYALSVLFLSRATRDTPAREKLAQRHEQLDPGSQIGWLLHGQLHLEQDRVREAVACFVRALEISSVLLLPQKFLLAAKALHPSVDHEIFEQFNLRDLSGHMCLNPFYYSQVAKQGVVYGCCAAWLPVELGSTLESSLEACWNSGAAQEVRRSIFQSDFRYCSRLHCPTIGKNQLAPKTEVEHDPRCAVSFTHGEFVLDSGPDVICFSQDPSCNLRCPQCRSDFKNHNRDEEQQRRLDPIVDVFKDALESARTRKLSVELSADGDPFYSRHYRKLLAMIDPDEYPHLNLILTTNGQLLEKSWPEFPRIHGLVERLCISVDAASEAVYRLTRRGSWQNLVRNLEFISNVRRQGGVLDLRLLFVVQTDNYRDMAAFARLGKRLGVDRVHFAKLFNLETFSPEEFRTRCVFSSDHPEHSAFLEHLQSPVFDDPIIDLGNLEAIRADLGGV